MQLNSLQKPDSGFIGETGTSTSDVNTAPIEIPPSPLLHEMGRRQIEACQPHMGPKLYVAAASCLSSTDGDVGVEDLIIADPLKALGLYAILFFMFGSGVNRAMHNL